MKIYLYALISAIVLFAAHVVGNAYDLYHLIFFYDVPMHILGGIAIALSVVAVLRTHPLSFLNKPWKIVFLVFAVGLAWELFEAYFNIAGAPVGTKAYYIDTTKDLIDDCIGAIVAVYSTNKKAIFKVETV